MHRCQVPQLKKILDVFLGCHEGLDCLQNYNRCPTLYESLCSLWLGTGDWIPPKAIFDDILVKIAVRSDRLCILVAGLLDASVTAVKLRSTHRGLGLNYKELMFGRTQMMTALCPAWANSNEAMCLRFNPHQLKRLAFQLPKPRKNSPLWIHLDLVEWHNHEDSACCIQLKERRKRNISDIMIDFSLTS